MISVDLEIKNEWRANKMGEIVVRNAVVREEGYLYYVDGEGNICRAKRKGYKKKDE